ncbi:Tensin-2 [Channa argus]|uniref:Tensin-2 n=1 Tax=Channa argus TaxID=215402 RepID=A0A6G1PE89_CHAAH|nr:Tensin-2 [Channa argus]
MARGFVSDVVRWVGVFMCEVQRREQFTVKCSWPTPLYKYTKETTLSFDSLRRVFRQSDGGKIELGREAEECRRIKPDELEGVHTHTFKLKPFKKAKSCDICKQAITKEGLICKACRLSCHKKCEVKDAKSTGHIVPVARSSSPAAKSVEKNKVFV